MQLINMDIPADLSCCAVEHGLKILKTKDLKQVKLLCSNNYDFQYIFKVIQDLKDNNINFIYQNTKSSKILPKDSWMLIYKETIFYSSGA